MAKVRIVLPNGRDVTRDVADNTSLAALLKSIDELRGAEYAIRVESRDRSGMTTMDVVDPSSYQHFAVDDGDIVFATAKVAGGIA